MTQEALKLALEALMRSRKAVSGNLDLAGCAYGKNDLDGHQYSDAKKALVTLDKALAAIKKALAQPEQLHASEDVSIGVDVTEDGAHVTALRSYRNGAKVVFYSQFHSAPQRTEQEPVAKYSDIVSDGGLDPRNKFDTPPKRTWVGLTDDEIDAIYTGVRAVHREIDSDVFARAIEAKLKEKNT